MKKSDLLIYRIVTGLLSALMLFSSVMYFIQNEMVQETFLKLGFPTFVIYPLAILKILGVAVIWSNKSKMLKEWAYAGFTFNTLLAVGAHVGVSDGEHIAAVAGLILTIVSYIYNRKLYPTYLK